MEKNGHVAAGIPVKLSDDTQLEDILNAIPIPIFLKDTDGLFQNCNKAYEDYMGLKKETLVGKSVYDVTTLELADVYDSEDREVFDSNESRIYPSRVSRAREAMIHKSPYRGADGRICGLVGAIIEVAEQKKAEKLLHDRVHFEALLSFISTSLLKAQPDTLDYYMKQALERLGQFLGADKGFIVITSGSGTDVIKMYDWCLIESFLESNSLLNSHFWDFFNDYYASYKPGHDKTDEKAGAYNPAQVVNRNSKRLFFPMRHGNSWIGFLGFEYANDTLAELSPQQMTLLGVITEVFINTLQRQRTEEALRFSEQKNKLLIEAIPDVIVIATPDCEILDFKAAKNFKYANGVSSYAGKKADDVLPPSVAALYRKYVPEAFRTKKVISFEYEMPVNHEVRFREARIVVISEREALVIIRDITDIKETQEEIRKLSRAVDQSPGIIVITNTEGGITYANAKFSQVTGYSFEEVVGRNPRVLKSGIHSDDFYKNLWNTIAAGEEWRGEFCNRKKNGDFFWALASISPVKNLDGKVAYYLAIQQDITEKKSIEKTLQDRNNEIQETLAKLQQTQSQLIQQEKLAGIGQLAAGVAHEINNPLGFVLSNFETLQKYIGKLLEMMDALRELHKRVLEDKLPSVQPYAEQITVLQKQKKLDYILEDLNPIFRETNDGLNRVSNIVKSLRLFSRIDQQSAFAEYDLNEGIKDSLIVARNEVKYVAEVKENLSEVPTVKAMGGLINQVLLNIILNAAHAIKARARETLGLITISTYADEQFVYCSIEDSGHGIPEEVRQDIFNPFFTTKPVGQGTGLGLSISYDIIVNKHHGEISFISEVGVGTTFLIKLPLLQQAEESLPSN